MEPASLHRFDDMAPALRRARKRSPLRRPVVAWRHRHLNGDDTLMISFPRSGSTWLRFMLAAAITGRSTDFSSVDEVIPYVGQPLDRAAIWGNHGRLVKSHERSSAIGTQGRLRFIYLIRDGRDVAVSYYYFCQRHGTWTGSFPGFVEAFLDGRLDGYGAWQDHVEGWLAGSGTKRDHIVVRYEDLHLDVARELTRCADFLRTPLREGRIAEAIEVGAADRMRDAESRSTRQVVNPAIPNVRSTRTSNWSEHFDDREMAAFRRRGGRALELGGYALD